ncbi:hypothetical protein [Chryseolinea soli]|uniref:APCDD1 domain-containing protein n=1 Tax=Chryseolinea soli TaxID=2321403 RepID=A0A385SSP2_9BACT|nr:hypothetical protein [Chryseolinea soli]AYB34833.1 hypothetical protein D4L85_31510 [Chryseolinea soli]
MNTDQLQKASFGEWKSIAVEVRPSNTKNPNGTLKPFYLTREFTLRPESRFNLVVTNFADPFGKVALARMSITGHIEWCGDHAVVPNTQKVDFSADEEYIVTPLLQGFADVLNQYTKGFNEWKVSEPQSIFKKAFAPFGLTEGNIFKEYDLIYVLNDMMFWGARHVDGRGFDTEENRPTSLQIPMVRK